MTNCQGVTRTAKDKSICLRNFQNTSRERTQINFSSQTQELRSEKPQTLEELRAARLAHFNK